VKVAEVLKSLAWKQFSEDVSELLFGVDIEDIDLVTLVLFADEVVFCLDVLGTLMEFGIFNELNSALVV